MPGGIRSLVVDYKSALQERLQALGRPLPQYRLAGRIGPRPSEAAFTWRWWWAGEVRGRGDGPRQEGSGAGRRAPGAGELRTSADPLKG